MPCPPAETLRTGGALRGLRCTGVTVHAGYGGGEGGTVAVAGAVNYAYALYHYAVPGRRPRYARRPFIISFADTDCNSNLVSVSHTRRRATRVSRTLGPRGSRAVSLSPGPCRTIQICAVRIYVYAGYSRTRPKRGEGHTFRRP